MAKTESLNIALTEETKRFAASQFGNGTLYATPSVYIRNLIRHKRDIQKAAELKQAIVNGYHDVIVGRTRVFSGNLKADLKAHRKAAN